MSEKRFVKYRKLPVTVEAYRTDEENEKSNHQNNYCIDCKHCIGEPAFLVSEDTGLWAMAYSCLGGNPKKKGMFTCKEKACEFFEEGLFI